MWGELASHKRLFKVTGKGLAHCEVLLVQCFMNMIILSTFM